MKTYCLKILIAYFLLMIGLKAWSQDTTLKINFSRLSFSFDSTFLSTLNSTFRYYPSFNFIYHLPQKQDYKRYKKYAYLVYEKPNVKNHIKYYQLACSLWELEKLKDAEKLFVAIADSGYAFYSNKARFSSDIPGDTTVNIYGYGSFTSDDRNTACIYLTKIYIEQKKFSKALDYLNKAVNQYPVEYTCGTGYEYQQDKYNFLYATCYEGLGRYTQVMDLLLPKSLNRSDDIIIRAIKKSYSEKEITNYLIKAEESISCVTDTFSSFSYITHNYNEKNERIDSIQYHSGDGTVLLFNKKISFERPYDLDAGEVLTRDYFVKLFKQSDFYTRLNKEN